SLSSSGRGMSMYSRTRSQPSAWLSSSSASRRGLPTPSVAKSRAIHVSMRWTVHSCSGAALTIEPLRLPLHFLLTDADPTERLARGLGEIGRRALLQERREQVRLELGHVGERLPQQPALLERGERVDLTAQQVHAHVFVRLVVRAVRIEQLARFL